MSLDSTSVGSDDRMMYQKSLIDLMSSLCGILHMLDSYLGRKFPLASGSVTYWPVLIQRRNIELLAIMLVNMATEKNNIPQGWYKASSQLRRVSGPHNLHFLTSSNSHTQLMECRSVSIRDLRYRDINELLFKLTSSFDRYAGKNSLMIVSRATNQADIFRSIRNKPGSHVMSFDEFQQAGQQNIASSVADERPLAISQPGDSDRHAKEQEKAVVFLQRLWRAKIPILQRLRAWQQSPEGQAVTQYQALTETAPYRLLARALLTGQGVKITLQLKELESSHTSRHGDMMSLLDRPGDLSVEAHEMLDSTFTKLYVADNDIKDILRRFSDTNLAVLVRDGNIYTLEQLIKDILAKVEEIDRAMKHIGETIEALSRRGG